MMRRILAIASVLILLVPVALLAQAESATTTPSPATKTKAAKTASPAARKTAAKKPPVHKPTVAETAAAEVAKLRAEFEQKLVQLSGQLQQRDAAVQQLQQQVTALQSSAAQTQSTAQAASASGQETASRVTEVQSAVADLKAVDAKTTAALQKDEKRLADVESPTAIHFRGITLTPGGYIQAGTIYRTHNMNSDSADNFGQIPLDGSVNARMGEVRMSGRASRLSLRAEAAVGRAKIFGYVEGDFLGAAPTANESQTNSFTPRLRLAFTNIDLPGGWSVAAGQNWSLLQTTRRGIAPLSEWLASVIDNSYNAGFTYARQPSIRVTKAIGTHTWAAVSVENPETVINVQCVYGTTPASCAPATLGNIQGLQNGGNTTSPNSGFAPTATPSTDVAPDFVGKVVFEPGWGHYEVKAIGRFFRDRVYPNFSTASVVLGANVAGVTNKVSAGGGLGLGAVLPVVKGKLDVEFQALGGKGIGRYGTTSGPDVTLKPDGTLVPVLGYQSVLGIEAHPTPKLDVYIYAGDEYYARTAYTSATALFGATTKATNAPVVIGYGAPQFLDAGCNLEAPSASQLCLSGAQNRNVWAVQPGFWYRFWKGREGTLQFGFSYNYIHRQTWAGVGGTPQGAEHILMTAWRYYLP
jgi:hypothetical protein